MLFYIAAIVIFLVAIYNYKRGLILFMGLKYLLVTNITVLSIPGIPLLSLDNMMTILFVGLYILNMRKLNSAKISFPWITPFILLCITWVCSSVFAAAGITAEISSLMNNLLKEVLFIWIMWEVIETREDFIKIFNIITVLTFVSCAYGFYEYIVQTNPLNLYEQTLNHDPSKVIDFGYSAEGIRGYRVSSVFEHCIGAGINWAMYIAFVAMAYTQYEDKQVGRIPYIITALLCIPGIIITKMRSGYFFLLIAIFSCINFKKIRFYVVVMLGIIAIILLWPIILPNISALISIFTGDNYAGSDASMRFDQLEAAFEMLKLSPITGLGEKFANVYSGPVVKRLLGLESIWFKVIVSYGLIGIFAYVFNVIYTVVIMPLYFKSKPMLFIALAYWTTYSLTSFPGVHAYLFYLILFYCAKKSSTYKELNEQRINEWEIKDNRLIHRKIYDVKTIIINKRLDNE